MHIPRPPWRQIQGSYTLIPAGMVAGEASDALLAAVEDGAEELVKMLVRTADVNGLNEDGEAAVTLASTGRIVELLIASGFRGTYFQAHPFV